MAVVRRSCPSICPTPRRAFKVLVRRRGIMHVRVSDGELRGGQLYRKSAVCGDGTDRKYMHVGHCTCHETLHVTCIVRRNGEEDAMVFFSLQSTEELCLGNILYNQECHTLAPFVRLDRTKRRKPNGTNRNPLSMRADRIMSLLGAKS
jgi:hypothetical protein